jgi:hypothetical protein
VTCIWLQNIVTTVTNPLPLAVLDLILIVAVFAVLFRIRRLFRVLSQRGFMDALWEAARRVVRAACIVAVLFYWAWGFNYRRLPLETVIPGGKAPQVTSDMLLSGFADSNVSPATPADDKRSGNLHTIGRASRAVNLALLTQAAASRRRASRNLRWC